jgi:glutamyl-tRNA reductase
VRERLTQVEAELEPIQARARGQRGRRVEEIAVLSTCNRVEVYAVAPDGESSATVFATLGAVLGLDGDIDACRRLEGRDAVRHLLRVAAGLDSMALGESEIQGQVAVAGESARREGAAGPLLAALFRAAVRTGKRVRRETAIGRRPGSVSSAAVDLAGQQAGGLRGRRIAVLGAGRIARKVLAALEGRGAGRIVVVNRTLATARALTRKLGADAASLDDLATILRETDVLLTATGSPTPVVGATMAAAAVAGRAAPLIVIDLAVPRDVDPGVRTLPGIRAFDLDDLAARLEETSAARRAEVPRAEAIVAEELERFEAWRARAGSLRVVSDLRRRADSLRRAELDRLLRRLPAADAELRERLERFSRALVNKLLHGPTERLRLDADDRQSHRYAQLARRLFDLAEDEGGSTLPPAHRLHEGADSLDRRVRQHSMPQVGDVAGPVECGEQCPGPLLEDAAGRVEPGRVQVSLPADA